MPVEPREAGRWKREGRKQGTTTLESAGNGSTRGRNPSPLGLGGTGGLDRTHVANPGLIGPGTPQTRLALKARADQEANSVPDLPFVESDLITPEDLVRFFVESTQRLDFPIAPSALNAFGNRFLGLAAQEPVGFYREAVTGLSPG
jgi:hypothetical protein